MNLFRSEWSWSRFVYRGQARVLLASLVVLGGGGQFVEGCTPRVPSSKAPTTGGGVSPGAEADMMTSWRTLGEAAEDGFDAVREGHWSEARGRGDVLRQARERLSSRGARLAEVDAAISRWKAALGSEGRLQALTAANELTALAAEAVAPRESAVERALVKLDVQGRALFIDGEGALVARLEEDKSALAQTWAGLRPEALARHAEVQAGAFDALLGTLLSESSPERVATLASQELEQVDVLERVLLPH